MIGPEKGEPLMTSIVFAFKKALLAAEHGRAQALSDTLITQYKLSPPLTDTTSEGSWHKSEALRR